MVYAYYLDPEAVAGSARLRGSCLALAIQQGISGQPNDWLEDMFDDDFININP